MPARKAAIAATGRPLGAKPRELRMAGVSAGRAAQDLLGEQRFPPGRDESPGVEVARMQRPEPHAAS